MTVAIWWDLSVYTSMCARTYIHTYICTSGWLGGRHWVGWDEGAVNRPHDTLAAVGFFFVERGV